MAESLEETEQKLTRLGEKVRDAWTELHSAKQEHRDAVRRALLQQMQQEQVTQNQDQAQTQKTDVKESEQPKQEHRHRHGH